MELRIQLQNDNAPSSVDGGLLMYPPYLLIQYQQQVLRNWVHCICLSFEGRPEEDFGWCRVVVR